MALFDSSWPNDPRNLKKHYYDRTWLRKLVRVFVIGSSPIWLTVRVRGLVNVPIGGPLVVSSNHVSNWDPIVMDFALPRHAVWMAKEAAFTHWFTDWAVRTLGGFEVKRGQSDQWALRYAQHVLEQGRVLAMFAEGTRSKSGQLKKGKTGPARLATNTGSPIVPAAIWGSPEIAKPLLKHSEVFVAFGRPIVPQPNESIDHLTYRLMYTIAAMLPAEARGEYATPPAEFKYLFAENKPIDPTTADDYRSRRFNRPLL